MFEKILDWRAQQNPTRPAILTDAGEITYRALARDIARMTTALALEDLPPGVVFIVEVSAALTWVFALALERLGHPTILGQGRREDIELVRPSVVVTHSPDFESLFGERVLCVSEAWCKKAFSQPPGSRRSVARGDDVVRIVLSSGTTGARKQVPITRRVLDVRVGRPLPGAPGPGVRFLQSQGSDTIGGLQHPLTMWSTGGLVMMPHRVNADTFRVHRPNLMASSPSRLSQLLPFMKGAYSEADRVHLRAIGSALPPTLIRDAMACEGLDLSVSYGSTEAGNIASGPASLAIDRPGAVGYLAPWIDLEIVDEDDAMLPPGQTGIVRIRAEGAVDGYIGAALTAAAFKDGWFYPNDLGHIDPDGVLILDGRRDDVINLGGLKLSSTRIEETILACEGVVDVAVTAFETASGNSALFAGIESAGGYSAEDVRQKVREIYGINIELVDLPKIDRNAMGKIQRGAVRKAIFSIRGGVPA